MMPVDDIRIIYGLTMRQAAFVWFFLGPARYNASKAAVLAGYSAKHPAQSGHQALQSEKVVRAIRAVFPYSLQPGRRDDLRLS